MKLDLTDVREKYKRKNKILFNRNSACLQELLEVIRQQKHRTIVNWSFICVDEIAKELAEKYPEEEKIESAIEVCKLWARGDVKMPVAKKAILEIHGIAKEIEDAHDIALLHAIGQGCSSIHVETHAIGLVMYELTAIVLKYGIDNCEEQIQTKIDKYINDLKKCEQEIDTNNQKWASFLLDDIVPNKEMELLKK